MRICKVDGCTRKHYGRGYCNAHYSRIRRGNADLETPVNKLRVKQWCRAPGCDRSVNTAGLCGAHYWRELKGQPLEPPIKSRNKSVAETIRSNTIRSGECLIWNGCKSHGYGIFRGKGAHRWAYELANDMKLAPHQVVHHKCANRACVEPAHLEIVTSTANNAEMLERNTYLRRIAELEEALRKVYPAHSAIQS